MRKLIIAVIAVVVLILVLIFCLPYFVDINQYRGEIQAQLQNRLHRPVQFGALSLAVFPLRVEAQNVVIGEDPRFHTTLPFAQVGEMDISIKLLPLLTKTISISSLTLKRPQIELIKDAAGVWNFSGIGRPTAPVPGAPAQTPSAPAPAKPAAAPAPASTSARDCLRIA